MSDVSTSGRPRRSRTGMVAVAGAISAVVAALLWTVWSQPGLIVIGVAGLAVLGWSILRLVEALSRQVERADRRRARDVQAQNKKLGDIAGTVGRSAPVVREVHSALKEVQGQLKATVIEKKTARVVVERPAEAPAGFEPAMVEMATMSGVVRSTPRMETVELGCLLDAGQAVDAVITLGKAGCEVEADVTAAGNVFVEFSIAQQKGDPVQKAALMWARIWDSEGQEISHKVLKSMSPQFGSFQYLDGRHGGKLERVRLDIPRHAARVTLGLVPWAASIAARNQVRFTMDRLTSNWSQIRPMREVRVATILDEFSHNSFRHECTPIVLDPTSWREQMEAEQPDLFFCESAWSGADSQTRPWKGRVYTSKNFRTDPRTELFGILEYCKQHGIPTVFWNKEDPSHFDDKVHNFVDTAVRFDHVFTTDLRSVERYKVEYGHPSVHVLPFAVQPRLFNPIEIAPRTEDVVFAGAWYANHKQRSKDMATMFRAVLDSGRGLKIYDRFFGGTDELHAYPAEYQDVLNPPVDHSEMARVYKESTIGMTINTEQASPTMFARRIFELMACNTYVVSNTSVGVADFFGKDVTFLDADPEALTRLSDDEINAARERNLELVLREHTYRNRMRTILEVAGVEYSRADEQVTRMALVRDLAEANATLDVWRLHLRPGRSVLCVSNAVSPLESSRIMRRCNGDVAVVVDERLLTQGVVDTSELFGGASHVVLVEPGTTPDQGAVARLRLHGSYTDLPVRFADDEHRYRVDRRELSPGVLIPAARLSALLTEARRGARSLTYCV